MHFLSSFDVLIWILSKPGKYKQLDKEYKSSEQYTVFIEYTAKPNELKTKGLPWELAKAFDGSAPIGNFINIESIDMKNIDFSLQKNGQEVQQGNTSQMIFSFEQIVSFVSQYFTLKVGDLIYTGTPAGVGKVNIGDHLEGFIGNESMLICEVK